VTLIPKEKLAAMKAYVSRLPSLEENRADAAQWLQTIRPFLYENWPQTLKDVSFHTELIGLGIADQQALCDAFDQVSRKDFAEAGDICELRNRIDDVVEKHFPLNGFFPRLSSRSAKDAFVETLHCKDSKDILYQFTTSERILDDLVQYRYADTFCYLLLREWVIIPKLQEWRCFIRDKKLIAISQYHYTEEWGEGDSPAIRNLIAKDTISAVSQFVRLQVIPYFEVADYIVDVWLGDHGTKMIELNPWGLSDPCLFTYAELEEFGRIEDEGIGDAFRTNCPSNS
jgi:hypothetical protein